jgi:nitroreductase
MKEDMVKKASSQGSKKSDSTSRIESIDKVNILLDLIKSRRSIRFFEKTPIPEKHLMIILEGARWAPSAANAQPWEFLVIKDERAKKNLMNTMKKAGKAVRKRYAQFPWGNNRDPELISKNAAIVAVCADYNKEELRKYDVFPSDHKKEQVSNSIAAAITNMMLMATALGIGSLWVTPVFTEEIKRLLFIPENMQLAALVILGYPARGVERTRRRPLEKMVHYDKFNATYQQGALQT